MADNSKRFFQNIEQIALGSALENFAQKRAAWRQHITSKVCRGFGKADNPQMIRLGVTNRRRRHVGQHQIGHAIGEPRHQFGLGPDFGEIEF